MPINEELMARVAHIPTGESPVFGFINFGLCSETGRLIRSARADPPKRPPRDFSVTMHFRYGPSWSVVDRMRERAEEFGYRCQTIAGKLGVHVADVESLMRQRCIESPLPMEAVLLRVMREMQAGLLSTCDVPSPLLEIFGDVLAEEEDGLGLVIGVQDEPSVRDLVETRGCPGPLLGRRAGDPPSVRLFKGPLLRAANTDVERLRALLRATIRGQSMISAAANSG